MGFNGVINEVDTAISFIQFVLFVPIALIITTFHICWCMYLVRDTIFSTRSAQKEFLLDDRTIQRNYLIRAKNDKFLITILLLELLVTFSYGLGFSYPYLNSLTSYLGKTGLPVNSTCLNQVSGYQTETYELQYPEVGFFLSSGRAMLILAMAVGDYMVKFITNTYVEKNWKYTHEKSTLVIFIIPSIFIVILGSIPQTVTVSHLLVIIAYGVLLIMLAVHVAFLQKALKWREQDLKQNNASRREINEQRRKRKKFIIFSRYLLAGIIAIFISEVLNSMECVLQLVLSNCFFPILYGIHYPQLLNAEQLIQFNIFLVFLSMVQKVTVTIGIILTYLPYIVYTMLNVRSSLLNILRRNSKSYRIPVYSRSR